jgi:aspartate kinase
MSGIIVQKYGGTSVANQEKIQKIAGHIKKCAENGNKVVAVVSAMGKETDHLISLMSQINKNPDPREADQLLQTGEVKSAALLAMALQALGVQARSYTAGQLGLVTNCDHGIAKIKRLREPETIREYLDKHVVVVAGFQGLAEDTMEITTLGRGGSDTTAVALAASLNADECQIYTDVNGVYAVDPRIVPNAKRFKSIGYSQMLEMATAGAGVLMDRCVQMARQYNINLRVLLSPSIGTGDEGTLVAPSGNLNDLEASENLTGIAIAADIGLIKVNNIPNKPGMAEAIFGALAEEKINIIDAQQGQGGKTAAIFMLIARKDMKKAEAKLSLIKGITVTPWDEVVALTVVSENMKESYGYFFSITQSLSEANINIEMINSASKAITVVVSEKDRKTAAKALAKKFELTI